jgi:hypothetical protein
LNIFENFTPDVRTRLTFFSTLDIQIVASTNAAPRKADIQHLLNYIDILYPNGIPINLEKGRDEDGIPYYKDEMYRFYQLTAAWAQDVKYDVKTTYRMSQDPEKIAKANWNEIRQMFTCINSSGRFSYYTTYVHAITHGYIRLILLRMKELTEL